MAQQDLAEETEGGVLARSVKKEERGQRGFVHIFVQWPRGGTRAALS